MEILPPKEFAVRSVRLCTMVVSFLVATGYAQVIGTVVRAQGTWCDETHQQCHSRDFQGLWRMYPVRRDSRLVRIGSRNGLESMVIRSRWGVLETFDCSSPRELGCKDPLDLGRLVPAIQEKNVLTAFFDAVMQLAADHPRMYDSLRQGILITRGWEQPLLDAVAELREGGLNLQSVLDGWKTGEYLLELCPLDDAAQPRCPEKVMPAKYFWDAKTPAPFLTSNLHPGLYRLYLCEINSGIPLRTSTYAELLVAEKPKSEELANEFRQVLDATRNWDATDPTSRALRRAYLYMLDRR
jgi:hypothetical protein